MRLAEFASKVCPVHLTNIASRDSFLHLSNSGPSCSPRGTQDMEEPWSEGLAGFQSQRGHFTCPAAPQPRFPHLHNEGWAGWCVRVGLCLACSSVLGMEALLKSRPCWAPAPAAYKRAQPPAPSSSGFFGLGRSFVFLSGLPLPSSFKDTRDDIWGPHG